MSTASEAKIWESIVKYHNQYEDYYLKKYDICDFLPDKNICITFEPKVL